MNEKENSKKTKIYVIASLVVSITFIALILKFTIEPDEIADLLQHKIRYEFFAMAIILHIFSWFLWGVRLKIMSNAVDEKLNIGLWEATKIVIANLFLACITPSMAGGEPVRIHLLTKKGMSVGSATAATLGERLIDAIFILICVPIAFFIFNGYIEDYRIKIGVGIGIIVFLIGLAIFAYAIKNPKKIKSFLIFINGKISKFSKKKKSKGRIIHKINREVDNFHNSMVFFLEKGKKTFFTGLILTILLWSTAFMVASMILLGLRLPPFFVESYAAQILLLVIVMMPTLPGSAGVTEVGVYGLYVMLIGDAFIGIFVLLFRLATYYTNLIAGAIFQYKMFRSVASFSIKKIKRKG
ncbi:MAG: flippase-like domain-containing protein [Thermoplasmatales archaeon]|nr:MAG: flippase-like domain-containing protein [Thermoplasmatales archaeon]